MSTEPNTSPSTGTDTPTTEEAAVALVRRLYDAYNARDMDGLLACWHPGGIEHLPLVGDMTAPDQLRGHLNAFYGSFPDAHTEVMSLVADTEGRVAAQVLLTGTFTGTRFNGLRANGRRWSARMSEFFVVEDGLISRLDVYMDNMDLARQLGLLPPDGGPMEKVLRGAFNLNVALRGARGARP
ncbi:ester cyclase [Streptomyces sp. NPDC048434]|uniref:ester cyclase n=1 Tax=Streptomyces sp. NPDC048434 TaxID=3365549 RepID=UPI0037159D71